LFNTDVKLDWPHLTLLAAYGLAYCYIASSPFLVFHVGRFLLKCCNDATSPKSFARRPFVSRLAVAVSLVLLVYIALVLYHWEGFKPLGSGLKWAAGFAAWICLFQPVVVARVIWEAHRIKGGAFYRFYKDLAKRRGTKNAKDSGIVDTYRHLREHGNALGIVFLEILLGIVLIRGASLVREQYELLFLALVLAVWVLPGALVWVIGSYLELRFSEDAEWLEERTTPGAPER
jgi:hypothetical protein